MGGWWPKEVDGGREVGGRRGLMDRREVNIGGGREEGTLVAEGTLKDRREVGRRAQGRLTDRRPKGGRDVDGGWEVGGRRDVKG